MKNKVHEGGVGPTHDVVLTKMIGLVTNLFVFSFLGVSVSYFVSAFFSYFSHDIRP